MQQIEFRKPYAGGSVLQECTSCTPEEKAGSERAHIAKAHRRTSNYLCRIKVNIPSISLLSERNADLVSMHRMAWQYSDSGHSFDEYEA
jgi:hypothetical protein